MVVRSAVGREETRLRADLESTQRLAEEDLLERENAEKSMSDTPTDADAERAIEMISRMCREDRPPKMSVPVQETDEDVFITRQLERLAILARHRDERIAELERENAELSARIAMEDPDPSAERLLRKMEDLEREIAELRQRLADSDTERMMDREDWNWLMRRMGDGWQLRSGRPPGGEWHFLVRDRHGACIALTGNLKQTVRTARLKDEEER